MRHALFRYPANAHDSFPQLCRLLSGAGRPTYFPKVGSGLWGVAWTGVPHAHERHQSWIAIYLSGYVHGWLRYCHYTTGPRYLGDPATTSTGTVLYGDKYLRFAQPLAFKPRFRRSHYLSIVDFVSLPPPGPSAGNPVDWIRNGKVVHGCSKHP